MGNRLDTDTRAKVPTGESVGWKRLRSRSVAIEALVALALALFALAHLVLHMHAMATTGLWNDEIASIRDFSSQGLWTTLTHYPAPNNHIFFNALNALLGWTDSYQPLSARAWSFAAMGALFALGVFGFARRGSFLEAGLFAHLLFMSSELMALGLQARGYGLMALFTLLTALCLWRHERDPASPAALLGLAAVGILGSWTIPIFALFAIPAMALCVLSASDHLRRNLSIALAAAAIAVLLHLPVAGEMLEANRDYAQQWGQQLAGLDDLVDTFRLYLFHDASLVHGPNDTWILLMCAALIACTFPRGSSAERRAARTLVASILVFLLIGFALGTPPARTVAPILVALVFAAGLVFRDRLPPFERRRTRAAIAVALGAVLLPHDERVLDEFAFEPRENWLAIARYIDRVLPADIAVAVPYRRDQLLLYVRHPRIFQDLPVAVDLAHGRSALLLNGLDSEPAHTAFAADPRLAPIRFPQNRGRHQTLYLRLPAERSIRDLVLVAADASDSSPDLARAHDGDLATEVRLERPARDAPRYFELESRFEAGRSIRSLVMLFDPEMRIRHVTAEYRYSDGSRREAPESNILVWGASIAVVIDAGDDTDTSAEAATARADSMGGTAPTIDSVLLRIRPRSQDGRRVLAIHEVWAYPKGSR